MLEALRPPPPPAPPAATLQTSAQQTEAAEMARLRAAQQQLSEDQLRVAREQAIATQVSQDLSRDARSTFQRMADWWTSTVANPRPAAGPVYYDMSTNVGTAIAQVNNCTNLHSPSFSALQQQQGVHLAAQQHV